MRWLRRWRRQWCAWRGHLQADWSPIVMWWSDPDIWDGEQIIKGSETVIKSYRCALHDRREVI